MNDKLIKVCGLTNVEDARQAVAAGADCLGLNFYPPSPRCISAELARAICRGVQAKTAGGAAVPRWVGVFVHASGKEVLDIGRQVGFDLLSVVQLHGHETPADLEVLRRGLAEVGWYPEFWKAIGAQAAEDSLQDGSPVESVLRQLRQWQQAGIDRILVDAAAPGVYGGTGRTIDWRQFAEWQNQLATGFVLAGGLNPDNVAAAIEIAQPAGVDVASGVESSPGVKDPARMQQFVQRAREAFAAVARK